MCSCEYEQRWSRLAHRGGTFASSTTQTQMRSTSSTGREFNTGATDLTRDLHADSGWNGSGYSAPRAAAPLAILDVIYDAMALILSADPNCRISAVGRSLESVEPPVFGAGGVPDIPMGEIGTSFYRSGPGGGIFLLGAENSDTEEYDRHVIAHEWGHYLEAQFSRSDSIGGPHTTGDQLDMRVAFGEGWGNALSAMVTGDSVYRDTLAAGQGQGFDFDVEGETRVNPGWYSEFSVQEILYDIFDAAQDLQQGTGVTDEVNLGFAPIFDVFVNVQRTTPVVTSVFPFINAIKARNAVRRGRDRRAAGRARYRADHRRLRQHRESIPRARTSCRFTRSSRSTVPPCLSAARINSVATSRDRRTSSARGAICASARTSPEAIR